MDWILTGASHGIGAALARELLDRAAPDDRVFLLARDQERLAALAARRPQGRALVLDLADPDAVDRVGAALARELRPGAVLVHGAGIWPTRCELVAGRERSWRVNVLGPLALQAPLFGPVGRVLVIGAGLMALGRVDPVRTPVGGDFSRFRTYANTKLAGAIAQRALARRHPELDLAVVHPGVVRTGLGAMDGVAGALLGLFKRSFESPEACAARLVRLLALPRWQEIPGEARWYFESEPRAWPPAADRDVEAVAAALG